VDASCGTFEEGARRPKAYTPGTWGVAKTVLVWGASICVTKKLSQNARLNS
jgi:hypothetical protein